MPIQDLPKVTLGNIEANDHGNTLMESMGLKLVDSMDKSISFEPQVYSRRKNRHRELESLKTSINYEGQGLKRGFLVGSYLSFYLQFWRIS